jgi:hypothetical protein
MIRLLNGRSLDGHRRRPRDRRRPADASEHPWSLSILPRLRTTGRLRWQPHVIRASLRQAGLAVPVRPVEINDGRLGCLERLAGERRTDVRITTNKMRRRGPLLLGRPSGNDAAEKERTLRRLGRAGAVLVRAPRRAQITALIGARERRASKRRAPRAHQAEARVEIRAELVMLALANDTLIATEPPGLCLVTGLPMHQGLRRSRRNARRATLHASPLI